MKRVRICQSIGIQQLTLIAADFIKEALNGGTLRFVSELNNKDIVDSEKFYEPCSKVQIVDYRVYDPNLLVGIFIVSVITFGTIGIYKFMCAILKKPKSD